MKTLVIGSTSVVSEELEYLTPCIFWGRNNPFNFNEWNQIGSLTELSEIQRVADQVENFVNVYEDGEVNLVLLQGVSSTDWVKSFNVNMLSIAVIAEQFSQATKAAGKIGTIVLMGSTAAYLGGKIPYSMTKAALSGLMACLNRDYSPFIRANLIVPGAFDSNMTKDWSEEKRARIAQGTFMKRLGTAAEVARTIEFIIKNKYLSSATINLSSERL